MTAAVRSVMTYKLCDAWLDGCDRFAESHVKGTGLFPILELLLTILAGAARKINLPNCRVVGGVSV